MAAAWAGAARVSIVRRQKLTVGSMPNGRPHPRDERIAIEQFQRAEDWLAGAERRAGAVAATWCLRARGRRTGGRPGGRE